MLLTFASAFFICICYAFIKFTVTPENQQIKLPLVAVWTWRLGAGVFTPCTLWRINTQLFDSWIFPVWCSSFPCMIMVNNFLCYAQYNFLWLITFFYAANPSGTPSEHIVHVHSSVPFLHAHPSALSMHALSVLSFLLARLLILSLYMPTHQCILCTLPSPCFPSTKT